MIINSVLDAVSVLTPSVVCFILWAIQTANRPPTPFILRCGEKICGTGEVYLTIRCHKTRTDVRTKLNFPLCALEFMRFWLWNCQLQNRKRFCCRCREREMSALSFLWFLSRYARKKSFLLSVEGFYINSLYNNY